MLLAKEAPSVSLEIFKAQLDKPRAARLGQPRRAQGDWPRSPEVPANPALQALFLIS